VEWLDTILTALAFFAVGGWVQFKTGRPWR
jgi:hypothetical protein